MNKVIKRTPSVKHGGGSIRFFARKETGALQEGGLSRDAEALIFQQDNETIRVW